MMPISNTGRSTPFVLRQLLYLWLIIAGMATLTAQLPVARLSAILPPGGKAGTSVEIRLLGLDLEDVNELRFSRDGISAKSTLTDGIAEPNQFIVTIAPDVSPGIYEARVVGRFGVSNPRAFVVGDLPQSVEKEPNDALSSATEIPLGSIVNGNTEASTTDHFKFKARKGQRVLLSCLAKEIDSRVDPVLVLYDSTGHELERNRRGGLIDFTAPDDGEFVAQVYDFLYRGGDEYFYRLSIGTGPHIDFIFPPSGLPGSKEKYVLYGRNLPGSTPAKNLAIQGKSLEQLTVEIELPNDAAVRHRLTSGLLSKPADAAVDGFEYRLTTPQGVSNPVLVSFARAPVIAEKRSNGKPETAHQLAVPCEYVGQFYPQGDRDWVTFEAKKGEVYWIEVWSHRLGLSTDPFMLVQRVKKNDKAEEQVSDVQELYDTDANIGGPEFNTVSRDPAFRLDVKEDGTYRVLARDLFNRSQNNPALVYRLSICKETPDFRLVAVVQPPPPQNKDKKEALVWTPFLRRGETMTIKVFAFRRDNFNGDIQLGVDRLPPGVNLPESKIEAGKTSTLLYFTADEKATASVGPIKILGKAKVGDSEIVREARGGTIVWTVGDYNNEAIQSRMTRELLLAVSGKEMAPISIGPAENKVWEISVAGKLKIPLKLGRQGEFNEVVKLKAAGIPALDPLKEFDVNNKTNVATLELDLTQAKLPVGTHTFHLQAQTKGKYRPVTPDEAKALDEAVKAADETAKKIEKEFSDLNGAAKKAAEALGAAAKAVQESEAREKAAAEKLAAAKAALEKAPTTEALNAARSAAEKEATDAAAQTKTLSEAKTAAEKAAAEAATKAKDAEARTDAAQKKAKSAKDALQKTQAKDVTLTAYSAPVNVKVTPAPIQLSAESPSGMLAPGSKLEIPVTIKRLYDFAEAVELTLPVPKEVSAVGTAKATIPKDQSQAKLVFDAAPNAKAGDHKLTLQAVLKLNNQELKVDQPIVLKVAAAEKASSR